MSPYSRSFDDPRADRVALALGKLLDELEDRYSRPGRQLLDPGEIVVVEHLGLEGQPPPGAILDPPAPPAFQQLVPGDAEHPRARRARAARPESPREQEDRGEHLGGQVGGHLPIAGLAQQEGDDGRQVAAVERGERLPVAGHHRGQELTVGRCGWLWTSR